MDRGLVGSFAEDFCWGVERGERFFDAPRRDGWGAENGLAGIDGLQVIITFGVIPVGGKGRGVVA